MAQPYIGEIRIFAGDFVPLGWALCNGQLLAISELDALFALIGTTYGGDGQTTFAVPDLRGRAPLHQNFQHPIGASGGVERVTLGAQHVPPHGHLVLASSQPASAGTPSGKVTAATLGSTKLYAFASGQPTANMAASAVSTVGGSGSHENRMPFMALNFIISLFGIFPSQS